MKHTHTHHTHTHTKPIAIAIARNKSNLHRGDLSHVPPVFPLLRSPFGKVAFKGLLEAHLAVLLDVLLEFGVLSVKVVKL